MATNNTLLLLLLCASATAGAGEASTATSCQAAAGQPLIANGKAALDRNPTDLPSRFKLADAWSDAGCFNEALQVLQRGRELHPESKELETRFRVARSLVGEETYFENLDRANADAKLRRDVFRCTTLADLDACNDAVQAKPDDPALLVAQGDALARATRPAEAVDRYRRASALAPDFPDLAEKITGAEAQLPPSRPGGTTPTEDGVKLTRAASAASDARLARVDTNAIAAHSVRRYSNAEPVSRSH